MGQLEAAKQPEASKQPEQEKKTAQYSIADLAAAKKDAESNIQTAVKHPDVQKEALKSLGDALSSIEADLAKMEAEKKQETAQVKARVNEAIRNILADQRFQTFTSIQSGSVKFEYDNPVQMSKYDEEKAKADATVKNTDYYLKNIDSGRVAYRTGEAFITVVKEKKTDEKGELTTLNYRLVKIAGNQITEEPRTLGIDTALNTAQDFSNQWEAWKKGGEKSFKYGNPEKTYPPENFDVDDFLKTKGLSRSSLTMDMLLNIYESGVKKLDVETTKTTSTIEWKDGKPVITGKRIEKTRFLSGTGEAEEQDAEGRTIKTEKIESKIINRQRRKVKTVTEYWPQPSGHPLKIKKEESFRDGVIAGRTEFDRSGKMVRRESFVEGDEGISAVDEPTGKMIQEIDEDGKPVKDEFTGQPKMIPEVNRTLRFKGPDGQPIAVRTLTAENQERQKKGLPPISGIQYMQKLARALLTDAQKRAFFNLMLHYRADYPPDETNPAKQDDHWQTGEQTVERAENGVMIGDCEDYAHFAHRLNTLQGSRSYVIGMPSHATCVAFSQTPTGQIYVTDSGTFGHKTYGPFSDKTSALKHLEQNVYSYAASGIASLGKGQIVSGDHVDQLALKGDETAFSLNRQIVSPLKISDIAVNPIPAPPRDAIAATQPPEGAGRG